MSSKEHLQRQLRRYFGRNVVPIAEMRDVSSLALDQLKKLMLENHLQLLGERGDMERALINKTGCNEFFIFEDVPIDSLNIIQLEELVADIAPIGNEAINANENLEQNAETRRTVQQERAAVGNEAINANENLVQNNEQNAVTRRTIRTVQQEMAANCGFREEVIWDLMPANDAEIMKTKIKELIPDREKGQKAIERLREEIFTSVWAQRKYTNKVSVTYIFYVMVTKDTDFNTALDSTEFSCHPVFRCKKCDNQSNSKDCCMVYIDETGRVYQNWKSFIEENVLPAGTMVAPRKGIYNFDANNKVILDIYSTPSGSPGAKFMSAAQTGTAVAGIGAACVPIAAACALPVAAPVMAAAGIVGLGVGAFSSITSAMNLVDRKKHEQSIDMGNREARSSYLGILGGVVGIAAAGATRAMTSLASAGKATASIEVLVNGINISSILLSGSGLANGIWDLILKYSDDDKITALDVLQLSASLVIFTHSVYNFQLASRIANDARVNSMRAYRETLSNRQRKMFDKLSKETIRIRGNTQGRIDVLRGINEIPSRQYLNDLFKINKQLNARNVRPAFGESGIVLNNEMPVETATLRQSVQHGVGPNILEQVSQPIPTTHNSETFTTATPPAARLLYATGTTRQNIDNLQDPFLDNINTSSNSIAILGNLAIMLPNGLLIMLTEFGTEFMKRVVDGENFQDVILSMADNLRPETFQYLIKLAQQFIENSLMNIQKLIGIFIPTESVLYRMLKHVLDNYTDLSFENIAKKRNEILQGIKNYYLSLNPKNPTKSLQTCPVCNGRFFITNI
ncbi:hypothetical protein DOY81_003022 [Sarcophaga bullata]|nr:hypothetical protein DOY81_003022 [Sarcophaga bullata]